MSESWDDIDQTEIKPARFARAHILYFTKVRRPRLLTAIRVVLMIYVRPGNVRVATYNYILIPLEIHLCVPTN